MRLINTDGTPRVTLVNAVVLHVGTMAVSSHYASQHLQPLVHSAPMDIIQRLLVDFGSESRYVLLNGVANQLRYPNNHTHYFSCAMLHLFAEAEDERVQEQITRAQRRALRAPAPSQNRTRSFL